MRSALNESSTLQGLDSESDQGVGFVAETERETHTDAHTMAVEILCGNGLVFLLH